MPRREPGECGRCTSRSIAPPRHDAGRAPTRSGRDAPADPRRRRDATVYLIAGRRAPAPDVAAGRDALARASPAPTATCRRRLPFSGASRRRLRREAGPFVPRAVPRQADAVRCGRDPGRGAQWRLISHLALNHLSLVEQRASRRCASILELYDFADSPVTRQQIAGITAASSTERGRCATSAARSAAGCGSTVEFDREQFVGTRRLPVRRRARAVPRPVRLDQLLHPARRAHAARRGAPADDGRRGPASRSCSERAAPRWSRTASTSSRRCGCSSASRPAARRSGATGRRAREAVRFRAEASLAFPASEILELAARRGRRPARMTVRLHGPDRPAGRPAAPLHRRC